DHTHRTTDLWTAGLDGSGLRDLSRTLDRDPDNLRWAPDGKGIYFTAPDRGSINVRYLDLAGGLRDVTQGAQVVSLTSLARTLVGVGVRSDPEHGPDVVRIDLRRGQAPTRVTAVNDDVLGNKRLGRVEELWYTSTGGRRGRGGRSRLRGHHTPVRVRVLGRRRAFELGDWTHQPLRGGRGALPGDRLDQHGGPDGHPAVHVQLLPSGVLGQARRVAGALVAHVCGARDHADAPDDGRARPAHAHS